MVIDTERLVLRHWQEKDFQPFAEINACPHVCAFLPAPMTRAESDNLAWRISRHFDEHGFGLYAVELKETGAFMGFCGLSIPGFEAHFMPNVEIGWRLGYAYWGKGYATEAARAVLNHGFSTLLLPEIVSFTAEANHRSRRVMEKTGMSHNPQDDFDHPKLPEGHALRRHVLYRLRSGRA